MNNDAGNIVPIYLFIIEIVHEVHLLNIGMHEELEQLKCQNNNVVKR